MSALAILTVECPSRGSESVGWRMDADADADADADGCELGGCRTDVEEKRSGKHHKVSVKSVNNVGEKN